MQGAGRDRAVAAGQAVAPGSPNGGRAADHAGTASSMVAGASADATSWWHRRPFYKMHGSGNDFVIVDARPGSGVPDLGAAVLDPGADLVRRLCARGTGVGADGLVIVMRSDRADAAMRYFNSDGSRATLCGNAALCVTRLAAELGIGPPGGMRLETDAGVLAARATAGGAEVEMPVVRSVRADADIAKAAGEATIGFADSGVPHLVVACADVANADVVGRGRVLRRHSSLPAGANVNFVSQGVGGEWLMRTYERGVEGETLACGTGAVAAAVLLAAWGRSAGGATLRTGAGTVLVVRLRSSENGEWRPWLCGPAALTFVGELREL